jgi:hypothetical protein
MGIDLQLLPVDYDSRRTGPEPDDGAPWAYSHTTLNVPRVQGSWDAIERLATPVDITFSSTATDYQSEMAGEPQVCDCYGKPLTWAPAAKVAKVLSRARIDQGPQADERMAAIVAYLRALPAATPVVLYWS